MFKFRNLPVDIILLMALFPLLVISVFFIYSSGISVAKPHTNYQFIKQMIWIGVGLVALVALSLYNYRLLFDRAWWIYGIFIGLVLFLAFFAQARNGAKSWFGLSGLGINLGIQPSEFLKIALILALARFMEVNQDKMSKLSMFFATLSILFLPLIFIILQGDLGTALVLIPIYFFMVVVGGVNLKLILYGSFFLFFTALFIILQIWAPHSTGKLFLLTDINFFLFLELGLGILFIIGFLGYRFGNLSFFLVPTIFLLLLILSSFVSFGINMLLKEYMKNRILSLIDPTLDKLNSGWNIIQSLRAIGSGGILGKGFLKGTLAHYGYLPEQSQSTDFLFAVIGEEIGFIGCLVIFLLEIAIMFRLLYIGRMAVDRFGALFCVGLAGMIFFHFMENVGMTLGVMPVTGIPLLFVSYGGSAMINSLIGLGIASSINRKREE